MLSTLAATLATAAVCTLAQVPAPPANPLPEAPEAPMTAADLLRPSPTSQGVWPLRPRPPVVEGFDPPDQPWGAGHRGVDLVGHAGQTVHAALGGRISFAGPLAGRGVVVVDHGATRTTYEPVSALVAVGETVEKGAALGTLQSARSHCRPRSCLHWGLRRAEAYLNPLTLVGAGPVRLLPLSGVPAQTPVGAILTPVDVRAGMPLEGVRW